MTLQLSTSLDIRRKTKRWVQMWLPLWWSN